MATQTTGFSTPQKRNVLVIIALLLVAVGIFISGYLSYTETIGKSPVCVEGVQGVDCGAVQSSAYSKLAGIPIAYLGLGTYLLLGAMLLRENRITFLRDYGITLVFGITLFGFIYSIYLIYVQAVLLQAFCVWCLAQEAAMTLLFVVATIRLVQSLRAN